jgi:putative hydrolase of the HAD superfamily
VGRALLWDFDGTLAYRDGMWSGCLVDVLDAHAPGHGLEREHFRGLLSDGFPWNRPEVAHPELADPDAWWTALEPVIGAALGSLGHDAALAVHVRERFVDVRAWRLFDDTLETLGLLAAEGWRHVVLSNHVPELGDLIDALGLRPHLHAIVNSAETGFEKPHPQAFALARAAAGHPDVVWMIGDNPVADGEGAAAVGIEAILVRGETGRALADVPALVSRSPRPAR